MHGHSQSILWCDMLMHIASQSQWYSLTHWPLRYVKVKFMKHIFQIHFTNWYFDYFLWRWPEVTRIFTAIAESTILYNKFKITHLKTTNISQGLMSSTNPGQIVPCAWVTCLCYLFTSCTGKYHLFSKFIISDKYLSALVYDSKYITKVILAVLCNCCILKLNHKVG